MAHRFGWSFGFVIALSGCEQVLDIPGKQLPQAEFSIHRIDFGEIASGENASQDVIITNTGGLPLGVGSVVLGTDEMEDNFSIWYHPANVSCAGESSSDDDGGSSAGDDSGGPDTNADTGMMPSDEAGGNQVIIIPTDCTFNFTVTMDPQQVGRLHGSVHVEMVTEDQEQPEYYRDPDRFREVILLEGEGDFGSGNIVVSPRTLDFGYPSPGQQETEYIQLHNVGTGPLSIERPPVDSDCDPAFRFDFSQMGDGIVLDAKTSTLIPVTYTANEEGDAECELSIPSNDVDMPSARVTIRGNLGVNPDCTPPTVQIIQPTPGTIHGTLDDLELELRIFDVDQTATSLGCSVTSAIQMEGAQVADCTPTSDSGYVVVPIPTSTMPLGSDTLVVTVEDNCGSEVIAATSYLNRSSYPPSDDDGDGFAEDDAVNPDCNDEDATVYPYATEVYDGQDNNCNELVDENTEGTDDDADGVTEIDGDCNDHDDEVYPDAPEQTDGKDNDCNGLVDDGTGLYDDDGDGFSEVDNDCNDSDPEINPAAIEYCDGIDNNCNGLKDRRDACVEIDSSPMVIGGVQMDMTALGAGESTIMTVQVYDSDGDELTFAWQEDDVLTEAGHNGFDSTVTQTVTWTAPALEETSPGVSYSVYVIVTDAAGNQDWAFGEITVYPEPVHQQLGGSPLSTEEAKGCGGDGADEASGIVLVPGLLLLWGIGARRRRD